MEILADYDAYLRRIGLAAPPGPAPAPAPGPAPAPAPGPAPGPAGSLGTARHHGRPDWVDLHRAHATTIPFENLDPAAGRLVSLELDDLEAKLVAGRRGGYCFEQNLLFAAALATAGIRDVALLLARVRQGRATGPRPRTHLALRVRVDGETWHADVGFGGDCLLEPIPFGPGAEVTQSGWRYRTVEDDGDVVLQILREGEWADLYSFDPAPVERVDVEVANWFTSTHPRSLFVTSLVIGSQHAGERRMLTAGLDGHGQLTTRTPDSSATVPVTPSALPGMVADHFGLPADALRLPLAVPAGPAPEPAR